MNGVLHLFCEKFDTTICDTCVLEIDSITLYFSNSSSIIDSISCDSAYIFNKWRFSSGIYRDTLVNNKGCDSISIINLIIGNNKETVLDTVACDSMYLLNQWHYTNTTIYDSLLTKNGCDSIVSVNLILNTSLITEINESIIYTDSIYLADEFQYSSGVYIDSLLTSKGCDSIIQTNLTVDSTGLSFFNLFGNKFNVYPNPFTNTFVISTVGRKTTFAKNDFQLLNLLGEKVDFSCLEMTKK